MAESNLTNPMNYASHMYNNPNNQRSTVSQGTNSLAYLGNKVIQKKALISQQEYRYFSKMATYEAIPRNNGIKVVYYYYPPIIDARNLATQGIDQLGNFIDNGNLFGSSFDYAERQELMPRLTEIGGNANLVSMTRSMISGTISKFGIRASYTQQELDFDNDPTFYSELYTKLEEARVKIHELQILNDLIACAGTQYFPGTATSIDTMVDQYAEYGDFIQLTLMLDAVGAPKQTKFYGGNTNWNSSPLQYARYAFAHPVVIQYLRTLKDFNGQPAFKDGSRYLENIDANLRSPINDPDSRPPIEVGSIDYTRFVQVDYMPSFRADSKFKVSDPRHSFYNVVASKTVHPILYVTTQAFTVLGYGDNAKKGGNYTVSERKPGQIPNLEGDFYNDLGSISIKWYYGFIALRPEFIAVMWTNLGTYTPTSIYTGQPIANQRPTDFDKADQDYVTTVTQDLPARGGEGNMQDVNMYPYGGVDMVTSDEANTNPTPDNPFYKDYPGTGGVDAIEKANTEKTAQNEIDREAIKKFGPKWKHTGNNSIPDKAAPLPKPVKEAKVFRTDTDQDKK